MELLSNSDLPAQLVLSIMFNLVAVTKHKSDSSVRPVPIGFKKVEKAIQIFNKLKMDVSIPLQLSEYDKNFLAECISSLETAIGRHKNAVADSDLVLYISLKDAVTVFEEVSIDVDEIQKPSGKDEEEHANVLLTNTFLARKF